MIKEAVLELVKYSVDKLEYQANEEFIPTENAEIEIKPKYKISTFCNCDDKEIYKVSISCSILDAADKGSPFGINVEVCGVFHVKKMDEVAQLINYNAVAILLPYVRNAITMLTTLAEQPPIFLPIIDVYSLREELAAEGIN